MSTGSPEMEESANEPWRSAPLAPALDLTKIFSDMQIVDDLLRIVQNSTEPDELKTALEQISQLFEIRT